MVRLLFRLGGWLSFAMIAFSTLGPVHARPVVTTDHQAERLFAYLLTGALLGLGYPRRPRAVLVGFVLAAVALEIAQNFVPGRDPRLRDALAKVAGAVIGVALGCAADRSWRAVRGALALRGA